MTIETQPFDAAEFLDSPEMVSAYLDAAVAEDDPVLFAAALGDAQKAATILRSSRRQSQWQIKST